MQAFLVVAVLLCAAAVGALAYKVGRLQAHADLLQDQLDDARTSWRPTEPSPSSTPTPISTPTETPASVPVITQLTSQDVDEPDPTTFRVASVTLAGPLIKVAAFSHGVRRALDEDSRMRIAYTFRRELRRQQKARRQRARQRQRADRASAWGRRS